MTLTFKSADWKHLRIPFSYYLLPVFLFALAFVPELDPNRFALVFISLHLFLYPSSNGYNSYFDKDEGSIGGLRTPPKVTKGLYTLSLLFFAAALLLGLAVSFTFTLLMLVYGLVSMAYSHPSIRLKKYPFGSWLVAGIFQGYLTFIMSLSGLGAGGLELLFLPEYALPGLLTTFVLMGSYPLTQVYQHEEDARRGDQTLSLLLGKKGTFRFSAVWFLLSGLAFAGYFLATGQNWAILGFFVFLSPLLLFFGYWMRKVWQNPVRYCDYTHAMWMNRLSATALNLFFAWYWLESGENLQLFALIH